MKDHFDYTYSQQPIQEVSHQEGPDAALRYLERAKSPRWEVEPMAYWAILWLIIGVLLGFGIAKTWV